MPAGLTSIGYPFSLRRYKEISSQSAHPIGVTVSVTFGDSEPVNLPPNELIFVKNRGSL